MVFNVQCVGVPPSMMAAQYYEMPGPTAAQSWGVYPTAQNAMMSGQQTPGAPGTPQPAMMRSQTQTRSLTPQHQQQDGLSATALHTPGGYLGITTS